MSKYHINKNGVPAPCKAQQGKCPYGGEGGTENHYNTLEEAQEAAHAINAQEHSLLPKEMPKENNEVSLPEIEDNVSLDSMNGEKTIEQKEKYYVYADGTSTKKMRDNEEPVHVYDNWKETSSMLNQINQNRYSEIYGVPPVIDENEVSISEQEEYYLAQEEIEKGVKRGPFRSTNDYASIDRFVRNYLGDGMKTSSNLKDAKKFIMFAGFGGNNSALIIGEKEKVDGPLGLLGVKKAKKGILLKKVIVKDENDKDKKSFQLPSMLEIHYLDEKGISRKIKEHNKRRNEGIDDTRVFINED